MSQTLRRFKHKADTVPDLVKNRHSVKESSDGISQAQQADKAKNPHYTLGGIPPSISAIIESSSSHDLDPIHTTGIFQIIVSCRSNQANSIVLYLTSDCTAHEILRQAAKRFPKLDHGLGPILLSHRGTFLKGGGTLANAGLLCASHLELSYPVAGGEEVLLAGLQPIGLLKHAPL